MNFAIGFVTSKNGVLLMACRILRQNVIQALLRLLIREQTQIRSS